MRLTEPSSPRPTEQEEEKSRNSSPTAQSCPGSTDKRATTETPKPVANKGVILVSEAFAEINAGLVIVLASGHRSPILESDLLDPERDPDELAAIASTAYLSHVESYLSTTQPPCDTETAVSSGLLGSPLLGTATRCTADWCHAWSLLGQWSGVVTFPVPSGLGMDTCEESLTASKADNPIFISGPGPPMSKAPCPHSASSQARL